MKSAKNHNNLVAEIEELRIQLQEANETIEAIRSGQVDALVVKNGDGHQLYTLKSADQTYRVFIEKMKEGAVTLNKEGVILYSNSQFAAMVNLSLTRVIGLPFTQFISKSSKKTFIKLMQQGWLSDSKGEISLVDRDERSIPFLLSFTSLELDEGRALSIILTDLSAQKETEKQLKQKNQQLEEARQSVTKINEHLEELVAERTNELFVSREYFKFLADNIPVIVWTTQPDGSANYFNKQWYAYTGLNFEESKGSGSQSALHPDDFDATIKAWNIAIQNKDSFHFEYRIKRALDEQFRWHLAKAEPLRDDAGNVVAWFGTSTDIEDQKQELEKKDEFISVASHELRTPLTSLKGYMQLVEGQRGLPEEVGFYISKAATSVAKLQRLIDELLDASKIKAGKLKFSTQVFDLSALINLCVENTSCIYPSFTIKKKVAEGIFVNGNEERLEQVLMNLISNAIKYSVESKEILISAEAKKNSAIISIADFGIGISEQDQKLIFERFYRVDGSKYSTSGLGMGLYISSEIMKEHGSQINVHSKPHEGSVFTFSLPLARP